MTQLALLIAFILSTTNVTPLNAKYMAREQLGLDRKHHTAPSCTQPPADNEPPALWYYMDGDTPTDIAYSDYLEDLQWYQNQYPHVCPITPEVLQ